MQIYTIFARRVFGGQFKKVAALITFWLKFRDTRRCMEWLVEIAAEIQKPG